MATDNEIRKELEEIGPVLSPISSNTPYTAPSGYFEQFPVMMLAKVKQAKVVSMTPRRSNWQLAVAAAIAALVIAGAWFFVDNRSPRDSFADGTIQNQMHQVSDTDIAAYVERNGVAAPEDSSVPATIRSEDMPIVLADVSDQELQEYLEQQNAPATLN